MQRPTLALVVFVSLLGVAGSAKADTIEFSFVSTPNSNGTYVDAWGTITGGVTYSNPTDRANLDTLVVSSGTITVVSNIPPSPSGSGANFLTPELNGSSDTANSNGVFQFINSPNGIIVYCIAGSNYQVGFYMPGNPAGGGEFEFDIDALGLNGAPGNSEIVATDGEQYQYVTDGTLTIDGQVGAYDLTPEPPSWLLFGSGVVLLGFAFYGRSVAVQPMS